MENIFKVGDIVYFGDTKGEVKKIDKFHVFVVFDGYSSWFSPNNFYLENQRIEFLSFTPYTIEQTSDGLLLKGFSQVRPYEPKKGDLVWAWDSHKLKEIEKELMYFREYDAFNNVFICACNLNSDSCLEIYSYIEPYKP